MTENTKIRQEALTELARSDEHRSYTAQIRDLYDVIEEALKSGVSRTTIHQKLVDTGMTISLRHFDQALYRIRKSKKSTVPAKMTSSEKSASSKSGEPGSSKPAPLMNDKSKGGQGNFRQEMKQIRDEVENTNWDEIINNPKKPGTL